MPPGPLCWNSLRGPSLRWSPGRLCCLLFTCSLIKTIQLALAAWLGPEEAAEMASPHLPHSARRTEPHPSHLQPTLLVPACTDTPLIRASSQHPGPKSHVPDETGEARGASVAAQSPQPRRGAAETLALVPWACHRQPCHLADVPPG